ncbi:MAG: BON domain-containing protein [Burkholderiales bacterium]|jgi:osmotically-inducible protein OsmY|nr:BON domain-containing protein [Burkholderiales bacterium]
MKKIVGLIAATAVLVSFLPGCLPLVAVGATAGGVLVASDRRTVGTQIDDKTIAAKIESEINNKYGDKVHINVTSFNGIVLLTGEAPTQTQSNEIYAISQKQEKVRATQNEIAIAEPSSMSSRSGDAYITSKVKTRFVDSKFSTTHVKVVTERSIVYLMGLLTRDEAKEAVEIATRTTGVEKVVQIFEYTN